MAEKEATAREIADLLYAKINPRLTSLEDGIRKNNLNLARLEKELERLDVDLRSFDELLDKARWIIEKMHSFEEVLKRQTNQQVDSAKQLKSEISEVKDSVDLQTSKVKDTIGEKLNDFIDTVGAKGTVVLKQTLFDKLLRRKKK